MDDQSTRSPRAGAADWGRVLRLLISVAIALVGFWVLVQSTEMGLRGAEAILVARNGMATEQFLRLIDAQTAAYRVLGGVLLGVGGYRTLDFFR